jgi:hypothetical protein
VYIYYTLVVLFNSFNTIFDPDYHLWRIGRGKNILFCKNLQNAIQIVVKKKKSAAELWNVFLSI